MRAEGFVFAICLLGTACLRPSESRAERDRQVGHAEGYGLEVRVTGGLAVVQSLGSGALYLWAGAPSLEGVLRRDEGTAGAWTLEVANCLPDAELFVDDQPVRRRSSYVATRGLWSFELPAGQDVVVRLRSPLADERGRFRFGILSDIQNAVDAVSDIFEVMNRAGDLSFVLSTGDLTNHGTADELALLQQELELLDVPFFTTLGNHELGLSTPDFHDWFGRGNFHFQFRGVHFTLLDSASATLDPIVYGWLDTWLEQGRHHLHVVGMHIPPLDPVGTRNGGFASRNEAGRLLGEIAEAGVDMTFYGHIHSYYRFENAGIEAHLSGGGGGLPERFDGIGRHYLNVEADANAGTLYTRVVGVD